MANKKKYVSDKHALELGLDLNITKKYRLNEDQLKDLKSVKDGLEVKNTTKVNDYKEKPLILSAWSKDGFMMNIDEYCKAYGLPKEDISSYKLVSHTGTPFYNIVFKEQFNVESIDFEKVLSKYENFKGSTIAITPPIEWIESDDFDVLTYTDVHIGMETNADNNSMYSEVWNKEEIIHSVDLMAYHVKSNKKNNTLVIDELGDFLDGLNGYTTRGGHKLPQNMTDEQAFDLALSFKIELIDCLHNEYDTIIVNNICTPSVVIVTNIINYNSTTLL